MAAAMRGEPAGQGQEKETEGWGPLGVWQATAHLAFVAPVGPRLARAEPAPASVPAPATLFLPQVPGCGGRSWLHRTGNPNPVRV